MSIKAATYQSKTRIFLDKLLLPTLVFAVSGSSSVNIFLHDTICTINITANTKSKPSSKILEL
ncbi:MAG: hypothetical protein COU68_03510 [Candidatus Pacebacteria bacterium CG10_big_fil_rev_8_21_14_0_10_45_6]|nr:MAG: hypothetical protein COU68_03510 [Candidatus Pacebacteria bacterium CG10_big_fil_rev_8_21_14_0_10_45_6]